MKTAAQTTFAERLGRMLGRAWRGCAHLDRRAQGWLLARGWASGAAKAMLLVAKLVALGLLLYAAFWMAALVVLVVIAAWAARQQSTDDDSDFLGRKAEERDHREGPFYHPTSYDDDPDPRYEDD